MHKSVKCDTHRVYVSTTQTFLFRVFFSGYVTQTRVKSVRFKWQYVFKFIYLYMVWCNSLVGASFPFDCYLSMSLKARRTGKYIPIISTRFRFFSFCFFVFSLHKGNVVVLICHWSYFIGKFMFRIAKCAEWLYSLLYEKVSIPSSLNAHSTRPLLLNVKRCD